MTISVIIPTYNRAELVGAAVRSALGQTCPPYEVIVVDDGSTDGTAAVLAGFDARVVVIRQVNQGVSAARNAGIARATGDFVAFLDSDDVWEPWKLEAQGACFARHPELVLVGTNARQVGPGGFERADFMRQYSVYRFEGRLRGRFARSEVPVNGAGATLFHGDFAGAMFLGNFFVTSTVLVRREALLRAGAFDAAMRDAGEDYDLVWRVCELGPAGVLDADCIRFWRGGGDHLHATPRMALSNLLAIGKYMSRHSEGPDLPAELVEDRMAEAQAWAGRALFDHDRLVEARPYLAEAVRRGGGGVRVRVYRVLSWMPGFVVGAARGAVRMVKRVRQRVSGS